MGQYSILPSDDFIIIAGGAWVVNRVDEKMQKKSRSCPLRDRAKPNYSASARFVSTVFHGLMQGHALHALDDPELDVAHRGVLAAKAAPFNLVQIFLRVKIQAVAAAIPRQSLYHQQKQRTNNTFCNQDAAAAPNKAGRYDRCVAQAM